MKHWKIETASIFLLFSLIIVSSAYANDVTYRDVAPIFQSRCVFCHTGPGASYDLRLDSLEELLKGSKNGVVVKPGNPQESELVLRIKGITQPRMPLTGPPFLSDEEIRLIEKWIETGLKSDSNAGKTSDGPVAETDPGPGGKVLYTHVNPIFSTRCEKCHTQNGLMGPAPEGYMLNSYEATLSTYDWVRVVPGYPDASELVRRINGQARPRMPYDGPPFLTEGETGRISDWIRQGAPNTDGKSAQIPVGARVRLHGTLYSGWMLDNLPIMVNSSTRIDKSPASGDYIQVRGRIGNDGVVIAERIRRR